MQNPFIRAGFFGLLVCVLVFCIGEAGARLLKLNPASLITLDSCVGYKDLSSAHGVVGGPSGFVSISTNSEGFRDVEHTQEKPAGGYRVLFLGDSFTEAVQVPLQDTFWRQIQAKADASHLPLEIISMAVSSWSTGQELLAYECYGRAYHPDLVVLAFNTDDITDNAFRQDQFTPTFTLQNSILTFDETYKTNIAKRVTDRTTLYPGALYFLKDNSELLRYLLFIHANTTAGNIISAQTTPKNIDTAWNITNALITRLYSDVQADHSKLLVVNFPTREPTSIETLQTFAATKKIQLMDLTPVLVATTTALLQWPGDPHLTPLGHSIAAGLLFDTITQRYMPPRH